jgi:cysteine desulfurase
MENTPGVAAMAAALSAAREDLADQAAGRWELTERLRRGIEERVEGAHLHGHPTQRVPHLVCFSVPDLDPEILMMALDDRGFRLSAGSNCSGASEEPSPVLEAMSVPNTPGFRVGVGPSTTTDDVENLLEILPSIVGELRRMEAASSEAMARFRPEEG